MTWLVQEIWLWMALSALAGAVLTGFFATTETKTERFVPAPAGNEAEADDAPLTTPATAVEADEDEILSSPFPELQATSGPRPWEEEELWSLPAAAEPAVEDAPVAPSATVAALAEPDEWDDAADNWRGWAAETIGAPVEDEACAPEPTVVEQEPAVAIAAIEQDPAEPVEELSAAEKIRLELARLEGEQALREQRKRELFEAEQARIERGAAEQEKSESAESVRAGSMPAGSAQAEAERLESERLEAERAARGKARAERAAATRVRKKAERDDAERLEAERLETERAQAERLEAEKARRKAERAAAARARAKAKREETARLKAEQQEAERQEAERQEAERLRAEALEEAVTADQQQSNLTYLEPTDDSDDWKQGPFGPGSAYAAFDGTAPRGYSIKANVKTRLYHSQKSRFYSRTQADVWFDSEERAEEAGFTRWDKRGTMAHAVAQHGGQAEGPAA